MELDNVDVSWRVGQSGYPRHYESVVMNHRRPSSASIRFDVFGRRNSGLNKSDQYSVMPVIVSGLRL